MMITNLIKSLKLKRLNKANKALFTTIFQNSQGEKLSKKDRTDIVQDDFSLIYGEIDFDSFNKLLKIAKLKEHETFYDLGSGTGKAVIATALLYPMVKCIGVELLPSLWQESINCLEKAKQHKIINAQFLQNDFFKEDISDADVVFINATGFFGDSLEQLIEKLQSLKNRTRIIITSKLLPNEHFKLMHQNWFQMSWGMARVSVYEIILLET